MLPVSFDAIEKTFEPVARGVEHKTGVVAQPVETQTTCSAVVTPYGDKLIDGTLIRQGDKQAFVAVVNVSEPKAGDFLLWEGVSYTVMNSKTLAPAGVNVIYELRVRTP